MKQLSMHPTIHKFDLAREFADAFHLGKGDVVLTTATSGNLTLAHFK